MREERGAFQIVDDDAVVNLAGANAWSRKIIVSERHNFPTDLYMAESIARERGLELRLVDADQISVQLTDEVADKPFMEFSVRSKWCEPDIIPDSYNSGFEILDLAPEDSTIIHHIIDQFGFRDNKLQK